MRILVAEDDAPLAEFLHQRLHEEQFGVELVLEGGEAQRLAAEKPFDLAILDLNVNGHNGLEVLRSIRAKKPNLPVIMVAGINAAEEHARLLNAGADDSLGKPFAFAELAARIRAVLRRGSRPAQSILRVADLEVDRVAHAVQRAGRSIDLSPKEFALLEFLMRYEGQAVTRTTIVEQVWKLNFDTMTNVVDVYINYLRRKIDSGYDRHLIRTIRGVGYQIGGNAAPN
ncbi:MAG TPA: response regulator transcription factor [Candidatus Methylomirabilis sp.]|nr:response regulator transcription factor [Candidatus Methylomirabilis sp.]